MHHCNESKLLSVTTTVGSLEDARRLARDILDRRLAACVQLDEGVISLYRWQGRLCEEAEVRLTIKTLAHCVEQLQELFAQSHPYELPQFLVTQLSASPGYLGWARSETGPAA